MFTDFTLEESSTELPSGALKKAEILDNNFTWGADVLVDFSSFV